MADEPKETLLKFPCDFTIKIFGVPSEEFESTILGIVHKHSPSLADRTIQSRPSENGKYIAFSITIVAESKEQLDNIYQDLTACPLVLMAL